ncbi:hypothetical protein H696_05012 [Fonticula alba]|uniref:Poly A polymerase head domain-containing protein n=1 Tax=Fonticula alba TaxID=691883 RepID=A0A058Z349_FONAL|nr:hypothetical protein H696_05012 [Fonticula alba]KCV68724.1 hypothetical protein H696_05012 [Fonticula alba]|eukprot:XP_009497156.1 hypothetical protein H696_05012 [Fonticula alba]
MSANSLITVPAEFTLAPREARLVTLLEHARQSTFNRDPDGTILRFAGGWVRDKLLGIQSNDIDVVINNMSGEDFAKIVTAYCQANELDISSTAVIKMNPEQSKHLETATVRIFGNWVDFVNLRSELYAENSRIPTITIGTPFEDASRRDITINSLFFNLRDKTIEDFTGRGLFDLEAKLIRTPLDPLVTFTDDPLRMLRTIRFASRLSFTIEPETASFLADPSCHAALSQKISKERIGIEVHKMLCDPHPELAAQYLDKTGLLRVIAVLAGELAANPGLPFDRLYQDTFARPLDGLPENMTPSDLILAFKNISAANLVPQHQPGFVSRVPPPAESKPKKAKGASNEPKRAAAAAAANPSLPKDQDSLADLIPNLPEDAPQRCLYIGYLAAMLLPIRNLPPLPIVPTTGSAATPATEATAAAAAAAAASMSPPAPATSKFGIAPVLPASISRTNRVIRDLLKLPHRDANSVCVVIRSIPLWEPYLARFVGPDTSPDAAPSVACHDLPSTAGGDLVRHELGERIRAAGPLWHVSLQLTILLATFPAAGLPGGQADHDAWLATARALAQRAFSHISQLGLEEAHLFRPLLNGHQIASIPGIRMGPLIGHLLNLLMGWQLEHPNATADQAHEWLTASLPELLLVAERAREMAAVAKK